MKRPVATVLYEDSNGPVPGKFWPHELVKRCVVDALGCDWLTVEVAFGKGRPTKGSGNLHRDLRSPDRLAPGGWMDCADRSCPGK